MSTTTTAPADRLLYKPEDAAKVLSIGRSFVYELMAAGELEYVELSRRCRRIRRSALEQYVAKLTPQSN
ncbi:helix-turn-helix domain-containing protein [Streptomyces sp. NPDC053499]|uniref:helix-turn-helix domain-containing protein n=1 Tax=Streptomyces sp. NPDC053499 TaxID=3365707 RepID=UPI0037D0F11A